MSDRNYYEILGVDRHASANEIKRAYRKLAKEYHPDINPSLEAAKRFSKIDKAHDVLIDPEARQAYDRSLPPEPSFDQGAAQPDARSFTTQGMQGSHGAAPSELAQDWARSRPQPQPRQQRRYELDPRLVSAYCISVGCAAIPVVIAHHSVWHDRTTFDSLGQLLRFIGGIGLLAVVIYGAALLCALTACRSLGAVRSKSDEKKPISVFFFILLLFDLGLMAIKGGLTKFGGISGTWPYFVAYAIWFAAFLSAVIVLRVVSSSSTFRSVWSDVDRTHRKKKRRERFDAPKVILIIVLAATAFVGLCALLPSDMQDVIITPVLLLVGLAIVIILRVATWPRL